jgi:hypothetical protein
MQPRSVCLSFRGRRCTTATEDRFEGAQGHRVREVPHRPGPQDDVGGAAEGHDTGEPGRADLVTAVLAVFAPACHTR